MRGRGTGRGPGIRAVARAGLPLLYLTAAALAGPGPAAARQLTSDSIPVADSLAVVGPFDYDWSVRTPLDLELEVSAFRGDVLVVNVWATWCPPCVAELDTFEELDRALTNLGSDVRLLLVSAEEPGIVEEFARRHDLRLELVTEARRIPDSLGDLVLPTTFVVDRRGRIVLRHVGASDWARPEVLAFLRALEGMR